MLATLVTQNPALPAQLAAQTAHGALSFVSGKTVGLTRAGLANALLRDLVLSRLKITALLLLGLLTAGVGAWIYSAAAPGATAPANLPLAQAPQQPPPKADGPKAERTDRHGDPLPPLALARLGTVRFRYGGTLHATALAPNGRVVAAGGNESVLVWDAVTGKSLYRCGKVARVDALAFTPDSKWLASYDHAMTLRITEVATGKTLKVFERKNLVRPRSSHTNSYLAFLPSGKQLLIKDKRESVVHLLSAASGAEIRAFRCEGEYLYGMVLSADGQTLAVGEEDGTVRLWEVATGKARLTLPKHSVACPAWPLPPLAKRWPQAMLASPISGTLRRKSSTRWRPRLAWSARWTLPRMAKHCWRITVSSRSTGIWPRAKSYVAWITIPDSTVRFLADGRTVFVGTHGFSPGSENTCHFFDLMTGKELRRFDGHNRSVRAVAFAPDGKYVATGEEGGHNQLRVWEVSTGRVVLQNEQWGRGRVSALVFSPKGDVLASGHGKSVLLSGPQDR